MDAESIYEPSQRALDELTLGRAADSLRCISMLFIPVYVVPVAGFGLALVTSSLSFALICALIFVVWTFLILFLFQTSEAIVERKAWACIVGTTTASLIFAGSLLTVFMLVLAYTNEGYHDVSVLCPACGSLFLVGITGWTGYAALSLFESISACGRLSTQSERWTGFEPVLAKPLTPIPSDPMIDEPR